MSTEYHLAKSWGGLVKEAGDAEDSPYLSGRLVASKSGWLLLSIPNAIVNGLFDALDVAGAELPLHKGKLNAHISVMRPEELATIPGGLDSISERGHMYHFNLGPMQEVEPAGWDGVSRVWFVKCKSPELERLRKSYGLSALPNDNKFNFHATVAIRRTKVLQSGEVTKVPSKAAHENHSFESSSRDGRNTDLQLLAGYGGEVREPESHPVQGLRGSGDRGLPKMASELFGLSGGYGDPTRGYDTRSAEEPSGVFALQLLLGVQKDAGAKQTQQQDDHRSGLYQNTGRVGRADWAELCDDHHQNRSTGLDGGRGSIQASRSSQEKFALAGTSRRASNHNRMGSTTGNFESHNNQPVEIRNVGGGSANDADRTKASEVEKLAALTTFNDIKTCLHGRVRLGCKDCDAENCPHCSARLERGDNGNCNRCGKPWPEKSAQECPPCPSCGSIFTAHCRSRIGNAQCQDCGHYYHDPEYGRPSETTKLASLCGFPSTIAWTL